MLGINISEERNMFVAENLLHSFVAKDGYHIVYTDYGTSYPESCNFLPLNHKLHSPIEKSLTEKDNTVF